MEVKPLGSLIAAVDKSVKPQTQRGNFAAVLAETKQSNSAAEQEKEKLRKACDEFESIFFYQMLQGMRKTIPQSSLSGQGMGRDIFEGMFDQEISKQMSTSQNGLGLSRVLYDQLVKYIDRPE